jgi:hypothetical protein
VTDRQERLDLTTAEAALERGDYGQCLELLVPLAETHPVTDSEGARIRLLMITAWMGQGDDQNALATCQLLSRSKDPDLRLQAKQLLTILEAPSLARPERWSMRLPDLEMTATGNAAPPARNRRRSRRPPPPPPPPTGPTKAPAIGFAALVTAVLLGLTLLLSGCMRIEADLTSPRPDHLQMTWQIQSDTGRLLPWQRRFETHLQREINDLSISHPAPGIQSISSAVLPSRQLTADLDRITALAAESTGLALHPPLITLQEHNWLVGVDQRLTVVMDLSDLPTIPGLEIELKLPSAKKRQVLHGGDAGTLEMHSWRWSPLGLGSLAVSALLVLSSVLQGLRRRLGFGFPELPA